MCTIFLSITFRNFLALPLVPISALLRPCFVADIICPFFDMAIFHEYTQSARFLPTKAVSPVELLPLNSFQTIIKIIKKFLPVILTFPIHRNSTFTVHIATAVITRIFHSSYYYKKSSSLKWNMFITSKEVAFRVQFRKVYLRSSVYT